MPISIKSSTEPAGTIAPRDIVRSGLCIGCGACVACATGRARIAMDRYGQCKPVGDRGWFRSPTETFSRICPFSPHAADEGSLADRQFPAARQRDPRLGPFEAAYVGHAAERGFREGGSSGGMVTWVAAELLRTGRVDGVAHVAPRTGATGDEPRFEYRISRSEPELRAGAKSRYYPVELSGVLREIRGNPGRYAVVGVPCFVKAANLLRMADPQLAERIAFTLGLFCGHMKSARMIESFARQMNAEMRKVRQIDYRTKDPSRPANWYVAELGLTDGSVLQEHWWHLADGDWGAGFFQNPACDACDDVVAETADISFGDAWVEPYSSDGRGTNVVVVRSGAIHSLIEAAIADGRLSLQPVDAAFVERTQAAGFRQRREGLAYRLTWRRRGLRPLKRVQPGAIGLPLRRRMIYRIRSHIARWSHRVFWLARTLRMPALYIAWARLSLSLYQGLTYSRGRIGRLFDRLLPTASRPSNPDC